MATKAAINKARALVVAIAQKGVEIDGLVAQLRGLKLTFDEYKAVRADFIGAYCEAKGASPKDKNTNAAARKAWSRVLAAVGVKKPLANTKEAERKRQARQARQADKAPATTATTATTATDGNEPRPPASGGETAQAVKISLSRLEAHIIALIRARKYKAAIDCVHRLAEAGAEA
jgi:hypothetical protein